MKKCTKCYTSFYCDRCAKEFKLNLLALPTAIKVNTQGEQLDTLSNLKTEVGPKLQLILAWLDEYHMAYKDAKRWRRELEKFLTTIL